MPKYDGSIRINTKIETKDLNNQMLRVSNAIKKDSAALDGQNRKMEEFSQKINNAADDMRRLQKVAQDARIRLSDGSVFDWDGNLVKSAIEDTRELEDAHKSMADVAEESAKSMHKTMSEIQQSDNASGESVEKKSSLLKNMMSFIKQSFKDIPTMFNMIASSSASSIRQLGNDWDNLSDKAAHYKGVVEGLERKGFGFGNKEYDVAYSQWKKAEQEVKEYEKGLTGVQRKYGGLSSGLNNIVSASGRIFKKMGTSVKKFFQTTNNGANKTSGIISTLYSRFKGLALSLLIFNWLSQGFNAMVSGIQKGYQQLAHYDKEFASSVQALKNSLSTLGNSFASAFAPVIQLVIPALVQLVNWITAVINSVAQLIAALTGKSTWKKAVQVQAGYNDELDKTASSAEKAAGALAKFDDLDVLQKNNTSGSGGAGVGGGFEEVPLNPEWLNFADWLREMWENSDFYELGKFLGEKLKEALDNIPWDNIKESARRIAHSIATFINGFIEVEGLGYSIGATLAQAINTAFEFLNEFVHTIHWDSIGVFIADTLNGFFESIDWNVIYDTFVTGAKGMADAINSFTDWFNWDNVSNTVSNFVNTFVDTIYTFFSTADWKAIGTNIGDQISKTVKKIDWKAAGEAFSEVAKSILGMIKEGLDEIEWDEVGIAIRDFLVGIDWSTLLKDVGDIISETLNGLIHAAYSAFGGDDEAFTKWQEENRRTQDEAMKEYDQWYSEMVAAAETFPQRMKEKLCDPSQWDIVVLWNDIIGNIQNDISNMISFVSEKLDSFKTFILEKWTTIKEEATVVWGEFVAWWDEFWLGIWENILILWENVTSFFSETWEAIKELANSIWTPIKEFLLGIWEEIRDKAMEIWEKVRNTFEEKMNKVKEKSTEIIKKFDDFKTSVKTVFEAVKSKIEETIKPVIDWIQNFIDKIRDAISAVKDFFASGFEKAGEILGGIFDGGGHSRNVHAEYMTETPDYATRAIKSIPALASGAVIRGGNPFLAILGDQRAGQTNIEAPIGTIKQAVSEVMAESGGGFRTARIVLQVNGADLAQATLQDFLSEASRQGYNLEVIGG